MIQDFTIASTNKAAFDALVIGQSEVLPQLQSLLAGRRFELAVRPATYAWEVPPAPTGETTDIGLPKLTEGQGLTTTYSAWLRVWDSEPVDLVLPADVSLTAREKGDEGFDYLTPSTFEVQ
jgi:hypothetical protein